MQEAAKQYTHFIFDFDGVICDSLSNAIEAFNRIRAAHYPVLPHINSKDDMTVVYAGSLKTCLNAWLREADGKRFFDLHSAAMAETADKLETFPGIGAVLSSLGEGAVSIVTSAYSDAVRKVLAKDKAFDEKCLYRIAGREMKQTKTMKIHGILSGLGLASEQAIYVGDLESDIIYCRDVPIDIIAVGYGYHPRAYLINKSPTYYVDSVRELCDLVVQTPAVST